MSSERSERIERPLKIASAASVVLPAGDTPAPLRPLLQPLMAEPPRRVSRLIELSLLGAHRCLGPARPEPRCPLYLALTHGTVGDSVALVKAVASRGLPTPVAFINQSSNMAGFYVAASLGIHGSNQAVAANEFAFEAALELASLRSEHRAQALVGAVEECAWPLAEQRARLDLAADAALAESSHWLYVDQNAQQPLATVQWVRRYADESEARGALANERWPAGMVRDEAAPVPAAHSGHATAARICRFIEQREGAALLHLRASRHGCYAVFVTT
ncbi:MAG: hypothetical protein ACT4PK_02570 [Gammaproteobacteria bacterium]